MLAADVRIDAVARDGLVVAGQPLQVDLLAANRGKSNVDVNVDRERLRRAGGGVRGRDARWRPARRATAARR